MLYRPLKIYLILCRAWISLFAACSAATGFFLAPGRHASGVLIPVASVFLLACGASALNQYQERDIDAKMKRTRGRPLPSGALTPSRAMTVSAALMLAGLSLAFLNGPVAFTLGLLALVWYNGIYTPLKRTTAFAAIPGAAVGMIAPAIGWASGGAAFDGKIASICFIFFLWQVPHFWLLVLRHGDDYERAGLPSLTKVMTKAQIARITYAWITAAVVATLGLPLYGPLRTPVVYFLLLPPAFWLIWSGKSLTMQDAFFPSLSSPLFRKINIYLFIMMSLLTVEGIFF